MQFSLIGQTDIYHSLPSPTISYQISATDSGSQLKFSITVLISQYCTVLYFYKVFGFRGRIGHWTSKPVDSHFNSSSCLFNFIEPQFLHLKRKNTPPPQWLLGELNRLAYNQQLVSLYPYVFV